MGLVEELKDLFDSLEIAIEEKDEDLYVIKGKSRSCYYFT